MKKPIDYPLPVLEAYDIIEKLLVHKEDQPLFESNTAISDVLLFVLNDLFEQFPIHIESENEKLR
ncbi:MAG: hypothetical protein A2W90_18170 [Bacteroidetes bacterium GWF2_42_66]|nr:MAG: hypothetical protein A2W92_06160 [Bacteroidetes bacterium GWA2_42_15]OFX98179.1 MAG: hypothetical protein A2W89_09660 [Bacteroidetes bacterium GWE2_42_39]OFY42564.1 MAG: hypothetical protein A2W90_18170 [Bacteroidetes bacterium GWF2_42_66]HBL74280.1 hypothetical protein [Prolixibacteraceae bacterium]HCR92249.1 hypothetical protein [Prolixibacteraceae bacterium]